MPSYLLLTVLKNLPLGQQRYFFFFLSGTALLPDHTRLSTLSPNDSIISYDLQPRDRVTQPSRRVHDFLLSQFLYKQPYVLHQLLT